MFLLLEVPNGKDLRKTKIHKCFQHWSQEGKLHDVLGPALKCQDVCVKPLMPQSDRDDKCKKQQLMAKPPPRAVTPT